jgi:hypothetical protein
MEHQVASDKVTSGKQQVMKQQQAPNNETASDKVARTKKIKS